MTDIIVKKNGEPYATESIARQQMKAKGLCDSEWSVMAYDGPGDGWSIVRVVEDKPITLQPGDYVSTEGMDEATYHKVAEAFLAAGAEDEGDIPYTSNHGNEWNAIVWDARDKELWHVGVPCGGAIRHLTIAQVLNATNATNATNAGNQQEQPMSDAIETLKQRRQERDDAEEAYQEALSNVREKLGYGFTLEDSGAPAPSVRDLPPEEWREGGLGGVCEWRRMV